MRTVRDVHEFRADDQSVALSKKSAGQDDADLQVAPDFLRIGLFAFVTDDGAAGGYAEVGKLRQVICEALADAIAEIFHVGIRALVCERDHGDGIDGYAMRVEHEEPDGEED